MTLKTNWQSGDTLLPEDLNTVATQINTNTTALATMTMPYGLSIVAFGAISLRLASSYGDFPMGIKVQRACSFTSVTYRVNTADSSGNLVVELRKNGVQLSGSSATIAAANQVAGGTATGTWVLAAGDILTVYVTAVGTNPGAGLIADILGIAS